MRSHIVRLASVVFSVAALASCDINWQSGS
jgi:hypothetical protein